MAVDGWAVTFGTARRGLMGGLTLRPRQAPPHCAKYNSPPINKCNTRGPLLYGSNVVVNGLR